MEPPSQPVSWSPRRRELLNWFHNNAKSMAGAYEGAVRLLDEVQFPGRIHFIAHAVRDIANVLVSALDPQLKNSQVQYVQELERIKSKWPGLQPFHEADDESTTIQDKITIDYALASMIDSLVQAHRESRDRPSNYKLLFRVLMRNERDNAQVNERLVADFKKVHKWFMKRAHVRAHDIPNVDEDELQTQFNIFEVMLHNFVGNFFTGAEEIDEILRQANQ